MSAETRGRTMTPVERAAEVIHQYMRTHIPSPVYGDQLADALADAGLLLSDVDRAVLDAARYLVVCCGAGIEDPTVMPALAALCDAVETPS